MKLKGEQYVSLELVSFSAVSEKGFEIVKWNRKSMKKLRRKENSPDFQKKTSSSRFRILKKDSVPTRKKSAWRGICSEKFFRLLQAEKFSPWKTKARKCWWLRMSACVNILIMATAAVSSMRPSTTTPPWKSWPRPRSGWRDQGCGKRHSGRRANGGSQWFRSQVEFELADPADSTACHRIRPG